MQCRGKAKISRCCEASSTRQKSSAERTSRYVICKGIKSHILIFPELLEAVKTSLRAKVAALAEDNWMYEAEEEAIVR